MRVRRATGFGALIATGLLLGGAPSASARVERPGIRLSGESLASPSAPEAVAPAAEPTAPASADTSGQSAGVQPLAAPEAPAAAGAAASWGENFFGQLGTFYRDHYEPSPVGVEGLGDIVEVSSSEAFNLALLSDGTLVSWGGNGLGQLGDDEKKPNWEDGLAHAVVEAEDPVTHQPAGHLQGVAAVAAANEHAMALMRDGTVMAWGNDEYGQLGNGQQGFERTLNLNERLPKIVAGLTGVKAIAAGGGSDYAVTSAGTVMAWGSNTEGQLGLGRPGPDHCETGVAHFPAYEYCSERPLPVMWKNPATGTEEPLSGVKKVYAGQFAAYALLQNGRLVSWGGNHFGELGAGTETWRGSEFPVSEVRRPGGQPLGGVAEVAAGYESAFARLANGEVLGWGSADRSALAGLAGEECRHGPNAQKVKLRAARGALPREPRPCVAFATPVPALERLHPQALAAGHEYGLALSAGAVYSWGSNEFGQLGLARSPRGRGKGKGAPPRQEAGEPTPTKVKGLGAAGAISAGGTHAVALLKPGVAPPPPLVSASPEDLALNISWRPATSNGKEALIGERLLYRASERTGEPEPAEQGKSEDEEGPPSSIVSEPPRITLGGEPLEGRPLVEGDKLNAEPGGWSGARPIVFTYQWQRCSPSGESCVGIPGAKRPGYSLSGQDAGATIRVLISASGPEPPMSTAASTATSAIASAVEDERGHPPATSVKLDGLAHDFLIDATIERLPGARNTRRPTEVPRPLQGVPYEVRFVASRMARVMVLTPLASG
jgi:alpha-tubulin suppressor-like RCC1 family protein